MPINTPVRLLLQFVRRLRGVFQSFPAYFEQQPLLRVHAQRLARRDVEEMRIEAIDFREKAAVARVHLARRVRIGIVIAREIPAVRRHFGDRVDAVAKQAPKVFWIVAAAGKPAADADDGDRFLPPFFYALELAVQLQREQARVAWAIDWQCARKIQTSIIALPSSRQKDGPLPARKDLQDFPEDETPCRRSPALWFFARPASLQPNASLAK